MINPRIRRGKSELYDHVCMDTPVRRRLLTVRKCDWTFHHKMRVATCITIVISFLFVLGTKGRMQPVVMAPKNLSTKH